LFVTSISGNTPASDISDMYHLIDIPDDHAKIIDGHPEQTDNTEILYNNVSESSCVPCYVFLTHEILDSDKDKSESDDKNLLESVVDNNIIENSKQEELDKNNKRIEDERFNDRNVQMRGKDNSDDMKGKRIDDDNRIGKENDKNGGNERGNPRDKDGRDKKRNLKLSTLDIQLHGSSNSWWRSDGLGTSYYITDETKQKNLLHWYTLSRCFGV